MEEEHDDAVTATRMSAAIMTTTKMANKMVTTVLEVMFIYIGSEKLSPNLTN